MPQDQVDVVAEDRKEELQEHGAVADYHPSTYEGPTMKLDLHCHSEASPDCMTPLVKIPAQCEEAGIDVLAITDHNVVWGAQQLQKMIQEGSQSDLTVIVGEEISTAEGEIIGLFLKEKIEPGQTPEETMGHIKEQDGIALLPHGFDPLKRYRLQPEARARVAHELDIIETFNARVSRPRWNKAAVSWAEEWHLPMSAGSDAHRLVDIGAAWVEVPAWPVRDPASLLRALRVGVPTGKWTHPVLAFMLKAWEQARKKLGFA